MRRYADIIGKMEDLLRGKYGRERDKMVSGGNDKQRTAQNAEQTIKERRMGEN